MFQMKEFPVSCFIFLTFLVANSSNVLPRSRQKSNNGCELPQQPRHGRWTVYNSSISLEPKEFVPSGTILRVQCNKKYKLIGSAYIPCIDDNWNEPISRCLKTCPSRFNTTAMSVTCTFNEVPLKDCKNPVQGTIARFECADFYEAASHSLHQFHLCTNGNWNFRLPECELICGQKVVKKPTLIINGDNTTVNKYPWQAAIYNVNNKELICGGSLINQKMILTAAHCVTEDNGNLRSKEIYNVAVGKTYRKIDDERDSSLAQFSAVQHIFIPDFYRGETQNYQGDIAILITKKTFIISSVVQPVCVDWEKEYHHALTNLSGTKYGYVSGWGYTSESDHASDVLKQLKVPLVIREKCEKMLPEDYERYLTPDKVCAGFLNNSTSLCKGDSGGGLVLRYASRYYVMGIVSSSPQVATAEGGCDSQQYSLYTKVSDYISNFILEKEAQFRLHQPCEDNSESCTTDANVVITSTTTKRFTTQTPNATNSKDKVSQRRPGEISSMKCREFSKLEKNDVLRQSNCIQSQSFRVLAEPGSFPFMAQLGYTLISNATIWACSGTLISDNYIVTTAHCLSGQYGPVRHVRLIYSNQSLIVDKLIPHPNYNSSSLYEDIGLIKLKKSVELDRFIIPTCLNLDNTTAYPFDEARRVGMCSGWASSSNNTYNFQVQRLDLISNEGCNLRISKRLSPLKNNLQICGQVPYKRNIMDFTSGSSFNVFRKSSDVPCMFYTLGVLSYGSKEQGAFTNIANYVQWIEENVWPLD